MCREFLIGWSKRVSYKIFMIIILLAIYIGTLFAVLLNKRIGSLARSLILVTVSILGYVVYTIYLGIFLGAKPAWYYEGKFLVLPFRLLAVVGSALAIVAIITSMVSMNNSNGTGERIQRQQIRSLGVAFIAASLLVLLIFEPMGLGFAYQIAEIRRSIWGFDRL